jgi:hypothetical protein
MRAPPPRRPRQGPGVVLERLAYVCEPEPRKCRCTLREKTSGSSPKRQLYFIEKNVTIGRAARWTLRVASPRNGLLVFRKTLSRIERTSRKARRFEPRSRHRLGVTRATRSRLGSARLGAKDSAVRAGTRKVQRGVARRMLRRRAQTRDGPALAQRPRRRAKGEQPDPLSCC